MSHISDADRAFIAAAMPVFMTEATEQIDTIEKLLLELEQQPNNRELLDSLFRCAHTVKGSAGIFGLDRVVHFTHHVETLLDKMRDGSLVLTPAINSLLLQCSDQIKFLVNTAMDESTDAPDHREARSALVVQLQALVERGGSALAEASGVALREHTAPTAAAQVWTVSARFGTDTFRKGVDPLSVARYLAAMGEVLDVRCEFDAVPPLSQLDAESCFLGLTMALQTTAQRKDIEGAFGFVADDCEFEVIAPESPGQRFARAIESMPDTPRLGEMLVKVGAVSQDQLEQVLSSQQHLGGIQEKEKTKLGDLLETQLGVPAEAVAAALGKQQKIRESNASEERYIRVQADRLDAVINLLGELVTAGAGASMLARQARQIQLTEANLHMNALIEEIRNGTLGLRMVPVGETFSRFRRVVRDTAASLGKQVQFEIAGGDAELDKSMVEKIADPLMHLVRNSLDHGLEPAQERVGAGKPAQGKLVLSAQREAGAILIRIEDDGRGINRDRVLQRAWNKGLLEAGVVPSDEAINMLIFEPGFSTAEQITNLSGRGVGMDVVRRSIEALRGSIRLHNKPGQGLAVDIRLPLTLAIIDGFMVGIGCSKFVLPLENVVEVIDATGGGVSVDRGGHHCIELRGTVLPVVRLCTLYAIDALPSSRQSVVVVKSDRGRYGIEVDALLGQHQIVIKPLGRLFGALRGVAGSSILGNGEVALILDVNSLGSMVTSTTPASGSGPMMDES